MRTTPTSKKKKPGRGLGKFYLDQQMLQPHNRYICDSWRKILDVVLRDEELLLDNEGLEKLADAAAAGYNIFPTVFWVLVKLELPEEVRAAYFPIYNRARMKAGKYYPRNPNGAFIHVAISLLDYLYDIDHRGVRTKDEAAAG